MAKIDFRFDDIRYEKLRKEATKQGTSPNLYARDLMCRGWEAKYGNKELQDMIDRQDEAKEDMAELRHMVLENAKQLSSLTKAFEELKNVLLVSSSGGQGFVQRYAPHKRHSGGI